MASKRKESNSCPPATTWEGASCSTKYLTAKDLRALMEYDVVGNEKKSDYIRGGFMPCSLGKRIGPEKKYKVVRKLGKGSFSTVWLCEDTINVSSYSAIKISKSSAIYRISANAEIEILEHIREKNPQHPSFNKLMMLQEYFVENSLHGSHVCLKFDVMGPSMWDFYAHSDQEGLDRLAVKTIIKQVLEGLTYLHDECNIIHTDIKLGNILVCVNNTYVTDMVKQVQAFKDLGMQFPKSYLSAQEFNSQQALYGKPQSFRRLLDTLAAFKSSHDDNVIFSGGTSSDSDQQRDPVNPILLSKHIKVKIADFGCACRNTQTHNRTIQTIEYRALEVLIGAGFSYGADIWSVGILAVKLATGDYIFSPEKIGHMSVTDVHLALIWAVFNGIPRHVAERGTAFHAFFKADGTLKKCPPGELPSCDLEARLQECLTWDRREITVFANFVLSLLQPDTDMRPNAAAALLLEWLQN